MRRFVRSAGWLGAAVGVVAFLIAWLIHASVGEAYLIIFVLAIVGSVILIWPERDELRRAMRGQHPSRRPRR
jgi:hypothetical protein